MKFLALAAAASALRLAACDCTKAADNAANASCTNYATACPGLTQTASVAACCAGGVATGALKAPVPAGCAGFAGCACA